jgi:hypothetical protein
MHFMSVCHNMFVSTTFLSEVQFRILLSSVKSPVLYNASSKGTTTHFPFVTLPKCLILKWKEFTTEYVRFEAFTAVIMKTALFVDINTQLIPHRRHITSPLQSPAG